MFSLLKILYKDLKLDLKLSGKVKIGKTSVCQEKSTGESTLRLLSEVHPLPSIVLEYRQVRNLNKNCVLIKIVYCQGSRNFFNKL